MDNLLLGLGSEVRELKLGATFTNPSAQTAYHTLKYDFKPASVDVSKSATLEVGSNKEVTVTVPHLDGSGVPNTVFKGNQQDYSMKDCVLIIDHATGEITLERLCSNVQVKKTRTEGKIVQIPPQPASIKVKNRSSRRNSKATDTTDCRKKRPIKPKHSPLPKSSQVPACNVKKSLPSIPAIDMDHGNVSMTVPSVAVPKRQTQVQNTIKSSQATNTRQTLPSVPMAEDKVVPSPTLLAPTKMENPTARRSSKTKVTTGHRKNGLIDLAPKHLPLRNSPYCRPNKTPQEPAWSASNSRQSLPSLPIIGMSEHDFISVPPLPEPRTQAQKQRQEQQMYNATITASLANNNNNNAASIEVNLPKTQVAIMSSSDSSDSSSSSSESDTDSSSESDSSRRSSKAKVATNKSSQAPAWSRKSTQQSLPSVPTIDMEDGNVCMPPVLHLTEQPHKVVQPPTPLGPTKTDGPTSRRNSKTKVTTGHRKNGLIDLAPKHLPLRNSPYCRPNKVPQEPAGGASNSHQSLPSLPIIGMGENDFISVPSLPEPTTQAQKQRQEQQMYNATITASLANNNNNAASIVEVNLPKPLAVTMSSSESSDSSSSSSESDTDSSSDSDSSSEDEHDSPMKGQSWAEVVNHANMVVKNQLTMDLYLSESDSD